MITGNRNHNSQIWITIIEIKISRNFDYKQSYSKIGILITMARNHNRKSKPINNDCSRQHEIGAPEVISSLTSRSFSRLWKYNPNQSRLWWNTSWNLTGGGGSYEKFCLWIQHFLFTLIQNHFNYVFNNSYSPSLIVPVLLVQSRAEKRKNSVSLVTIKDLGI